jgi:small-conductance mechanosensitive channel
MKTLKIRKLVVVLIALAPLSAQNQSKGVNGAQQEVPSTDPAQIIQFLSKSISWYRQYAVEQQLASQPSDYSFLDQNRRVAEQVVQLAFDYARAQAQARAQQRVQPQQPAPDSQSYQGLTRAAQKTTQQIQDTQAELQDTREKLAHAPASRRAALQAQVSELESEVGLLQARQDALQGMLDFVSTSNSAISGVGLRSQIEELARSVPAAISRAQGASGREAELPPSSATNNALTRKPEPTGIWGLLADLIHLSSKLHTLDDQIHATSQLKQDATSLRKPMLGHLRDLIHQGDVLFGAADTASPAQLAEQKQQLDGLTSQFKQNAAAMLPLSKINILLDTYQRTLSNWRENVKDDIHDDLRELLFRIGVLAVLIAVVMGMGEIWRRTTFRYVHDTRRRYQFLLLRRIVMWMAIALIIIVTFASQLGSAVTFAGLLTAGIAVALQNVIVSIVAYFFLIGKYGIRVGDRVQIAGVTGEVVELGLVRIHLMELSGPGGSQPTGRVVAFSNSIVFQPGPGVFKQIPGTSFIWHEMKLLLAVDADYHAARERITKAVNAALADYRPSIEAQREVMARNLASVSTGELKPRIHLHYIASGIEATVTFPVEFQNAAEMDDHLMKEVMAALEQDPRIKLVGAEMQPAK